MRSEAEIRQALQHNLFVLANRDVLREKLGGKASQTEKVFETRVEVLEWVLGERED